jgi:hypothetical protein
VRAVRDRRTVAYPFSLLPSPFALFPSA